MLAPRRLDQEFTFPANQKVLNELRRLVEILEGRIGALEAGEANLRKAVLDATEVLFDETGELLVPAVGAIQRMQARGLMTAHSATPQKLTTAWPLTLIITDPDERLAWVATPYISLTRDADIADFAICRTDSFNRETGELQGQVETAFGAHQGQTFSDWTLSGLPGPIFAERQMWTEVMAAGATVAADRVLSQAARDTAVAYATSATEAHDWATKPTNPVSGGEYSAYYWAQRAEAATGAIEGTAYPLLTGARPFTGKQAFVAPATGRASILLPHGVTPTTLVNGDVWTETAGLFARLNGATRRLVQDNEAAGFELLTRKGAANGYASLDAGIKLPVAQLPTTGAPYELTTAKGAANGYAPLGADSKVPAANLPPVTGVTAIAGLTGSITAIGARTALSIDAVDNTADIGKPISIAQQAALNEKSAVTRDITTYTGNATLALADRGRLVFSNAAAAHTITIPANATVAFAIGTQIDFVQIGAGQPAIAPAAGVTLSSDNSMRKIRARYTGASLIKQATDTWVLFGNLVT